MAGPAAEPRTRRAPHPLLLVLGAALSVQAGAALATTLFDEVGAGGASWLRVLAGALILTPLLLLPAGRTASRGPGAVRWAVLLGGTLALMNTAFYAAIERLPLGVAVAVEVTGPLAVAVAASRRRADLAWAALAALSVVVLTLPRADLGAAGLAGIGFALLAAAGWAAYILVGRRLGATWPGSAGLVLAMWTATALTTPLGLLSAWGALDPGILGVALGVGLLASAIPYSLELAALRRVRAGVFGVMMAMEPAIAALVGLVLLGQVLEPLEVLGVAAAGVAVWGAVIRRAPLPDPP